MPLPNKGGEPEFKLRTDPPDKLFIKYKWSEEAHVQLSIVNITKERVCYKVKCTDNDIFRVRPPLGFIKPSETAIIKITLKSRPGIDPTRHFLAIYHIPCADLKIKDPRLVWTAETKPDGVLRMQAQLECEDKDPEVQIEKKEEKKDDEKKEEKKE